jgi:hypothetical protein
MVLSLVLLVSAGLFARSLDSLHAIELGFNREHVLLFTIRPFTLGYKGEALNRLLEGLRARMGQLPGVREVSHRRSTSIKPSAPKSRSRCSVPRSPDSRS